MIVIRKIKSIQKLTADIQIIKCKAEQSKLKYTKGTFFDNEV